MQVSLHCATITPGCVCSRYSHAVRHGLYRYLAGFYWAGHRSISDAYESTRVWASSRRQAFDDWLGIENRPSETHPDIERIKNMTEEEEIQYVYDQVMEDVNSANNGLDDEDVRPR